MKMSKKAANFIKNCVVGGAIFLLAQTVQANDLLAQSLTGDVGDSLGSGSMFWKIFILVDIILATAMAVKSKNPMVFIGVAAIAFIPAFLIKTLVF